MSQKFTGTNQNWQESDWKAYLTSLGRIAQSGATDLA